MTTITKHVSACAQCPVCSIDRESKFMICKFTNNEYVLDGKFNPDLEVHEDCPCTDKINLRIKIVDERCQYLYIKSLLKGLMKKSLETYS